ncbi:hypothetical protein EXIGLDRAFT_837439 [Exidia glandulosa HHB12029]|uniref:Uncharacterized protein n=1 Tax=Exidia glandulosa HHB12029 TaxID=1314781 RepID=A0A165GST6_EXIGL|nr:hypothetical protein EXIGLDRAFT_837439 [Exidia glandulosa HHB12029]
MSRGRQTFCLKPELFGDAAFLTYFMIPSTISQLQAELSPILTHLDISRIPSDDDLDTSVTARVVLSKRPYRGAALFATSLPDILLSVFDEVSAFETCDRTTTLAHSSLVCRQWHNLSQPLLWRCPSPLYTLASQGQFSSSASSPRRLGRHTRRLTLTWFPLLMHGQLLRFIATQCPNVSTLTLMRAAVTDLDTVAFEDFDILGDAHFLPLFSRLEHLHVEQCDGASLVESWLVPPVSSLTTHANPGLPTLKSLSLSGIPHLELGMRAPNLRALQISSCTRLPSARIAALARACQQLRELRLQWQVSDEDVCAFIRSCPLLEVLDIVQVRQTAQLPSSGTLWISLAAQTLPGLRGLRTSTPVGARDIQVLARAAVPLETIAFNRLETRCEADLSALVAAHRHTLRHVTFINWDAVTVRGVPAGDALLRALTSCRRLECLEVDFLVTVGEMELVAGVVHEDSVLALFENCHKLMRTPELVAVAKMTLNCEAMCMPRIERMDIWEEVLRGGNSIMSW